MSTVAKLLTENDLAERWTCPVEIVSRKIGVTGKSGSDQFLNLPTK
jgi:hypothetical protein